MKTSKIKIFITAFIILTVTGSIHAFGKVYIDKKGIIRNSNDNSEARYYGVNYTLPFAHAFRALDRLAVNHHDAIDRDVYHISRMGANAFRLHLWDVELTDSVGNLMDNEHLELLDYLIESLEERGIDIILTAQTNFGNGYPERDEPTGGFSYLYDKCEIHSNPAALEAQKKYLEGIVTHKNAYTGKSYADDEAIIAIEINNEPCHNTDEEQIASYINTMAETIRDNGWDKPVLYNVSHNIPLAQGYYNASIDGTTYQWYPIGLVSGHRRKGNFLPYVDDYNIPYNDLKGYDIKAKIIYEFDPADITDSYLYPAIARTFAKNGFQWATQFAYDPIDLAQYNTEYQTHYLNLIYTPQKALGMKIASKVMETVPRGADYGKYPSDTIFGNTMISYHRNLSVWNSPDEFYYTNSLNETPISTDSLKHIAGYGTSCIVNYSGRGVYMLDKINEDAWRLEVMPDLLYLADPFEKPSLDREVAITIDTTNPITVKLPGFPSNYSYISITEGNPFGGKAYDYTMYVRPGVYILGKNDASIDTINPEERLGNFLLNEYAAPTSSKEIPLHVNHTPAPLHMNGTDLIITAEAFGNPMPEKLIIYPEDISFWRTDNRLYTMNKIAPYVYMVTIPSEELEGKSKFRYRITVSNKDESITYPDKTPGAPLDWDSKEGKYYATTLINCGDPVILLSGSDSQNYIEVSTIPDEWGRTGIEFNTCEPIGMNSILVHTKAGEDTVRTVLTKYVGDITDCILEKKPLSYLKSIKLRTGNTCGCDNVRIGLVNRDGITFSTEITIFPESVIEIPLEEFKLSETLLCPAPFPVFLKREFIPDIYEKSLTPKDIEKIQISFSGNNSEIELVGVWLE